MSEEIPPRRRYPRIASHHSVLVRKAAGEALEAFAHTTTMAIGGCSFISQETFGEGAALELLIAIDHRVISAKARVVYERPADDGRNEIGVEFAPLAEEDAGAIHRIFESPDEAAGS